MTYDPNADHLKRYGLAHDSSTGKWRPISWPYRDEARDGPYTIREARAEAKRRNRAQQSERK